MESVCAISDFVLDTTEFVREPETDFVVSVDLRSGALRISSMFGLVPRYATGFSVDFGTGFGVVFFSCGMTGTGDADSAADFLREFRSGTDFVVDSSRRFCSGTGLVMDFDTDFAEKLV